MSHSYPSFPARSYSTPKKALETLDEIRGWWAVEDMDAVNAFLDALHHGVLGGCVTDPKWIWSRIETMNTVIAHWECDFISDKTLQTDLIGLLG